MSNLEKGRANRTYARRLLRETQPESVKALESAAATFPGKPDETRRMRADLGLAEPDRVLVWALIHAALGLLERRAHGPAEAPLASLVAGLADEVSGLAPSSGEPAWPGEPLTESETRVLRYLPTHLTAPQIAAELYISANTVKTHLGHLYRKLGAHSRQEAVQRARAVGLLTVSSHSRGYPVPRAAHDRAQPLRRRDAA